MKLLKNKVAVIFAAGGAIGSQVSRIFGSLAAELGRKGIRVVCIRPRAMAETRTIQQTYKANAKTLGIEPEIFTHAVREQSLSIQPTTLRATSTLAAFLVSDQASTLAGRARSLAT